MIGTYPNSLKSDVCLLEVEALTMSTNSPPIPSTQQKSQPSSFARRTTPGLSRDAIEAFQVAYQEDTGVSLSYPEAADKARALMNLMMIVTRPMQRDHYMLFLERMDALLPGHTAPRIAAELPNGDGHGP